MKARKPPRRICLCGTRLWLDEPGPLCEARALLAVVERSAGGRGKTKASVAQVYRDNNIAPPSCVARRRLHRQRPHLTSLRRLQPRERAGLAFRRGKNVYSCRQSSHNPGGLDEIQSWTSRPRTGNFPISKSSAILSLRNLIETLAEGHAVLRHSRHIAFRVATAGALLLWASVGRAQDTQAERRPSIVGLRAGMAVEDLLWAFALTDRAPLACRPMTGDTLRRSCGPVDLTMRAGGPRVELQVFLDSEDAQVVSALHLIVRAGDRAAAASLFLRTLEEWRKVVPELEVPGSWVEPCSLTASTLFMRTPDRVHLNVNCYTFMNRQRIEVNMYLGRRGPAP